MKSIRNSVKSAPADHGVSPSAVLQEDELEPVLRRRRFLHLAAAGGAGLLASGGLLTGCGPGEAGTEGRAQASSTGQACGMTTWSLTMGRTTVVGTVTVSNDATSLFVTYAIDSAKFPDCTFGTLHAWVGNDLAHVPANPQGTPVPGHFPYAVDASGSTSHTLTIPLTSLSIVDAAQSCELSLSVVTHAEVNRTQAGGTVTHETAFGGAIAGAGARWWFYDAYALCCEFGTPTVETCTTAFAKGGYVFTTDLNSNPERLPSLELTRNRWGWAINLTALETTPYEIWAGAGLNNTANGTLVGTLTVDWDGTGTTATVTYTMTGGCTIKEAHLYAGDAQPTTIAPGQYGHLATFDPKVSTCTFNNVPLVDTDGDGVWLIAHAVVCCKCC